MPQDPRQVVCLSCLARQRRLLEPCHSCGSRRLASVRFLVQMLGPNWKLLMQADKGRVH